MYHADSCGWCPGQAHASVTVAKLVADGAGLSIGIDADVVGAGGERMRTIASLVVPERCGMLWSTRPDAFSRYRFASALRLRSSRRNRARGRARVKQR